MDIKRVVRKLTWMDAMLVAGMLCLTVGLGMRMAQKLEEKGVKSTKKTAEIVTPKVIQSKDKVMIDISGEVEKAGVYEMKMGARINDVLVIAGGLGEKADREWVAKNVNLSEVVEDEMKIYIPKAGEKVEEVKTTNNTIKTSGVININNATASELEELPGVGEVMAGRIVEYREKLGGFTDIEELKEVKGIGEKMWEDIREKIKI